MRLRLRLGLAEAEVHHARAAATALSKLSGDLDLAARGSERCAGTGEGKSGQQQLHEFIKLDR